MLSRWFVWCCGLVLLISSGCTRQNPQNSSSAIPTSATATSTTSAAKTFPPDDLGRPIDLKTPAQRVIAIGPGAIETIFALDAQKQLVGRDDYADFPPAAKSVAVGGNFQGPNVEQCVALNPDLVIVQGETWDKARVSDWQNKIGVPVAALTPKTVAAVAQDIKILGAWLGREDAAKRLLLPWAELQKRDVPTAKTKRLKAFIETGRSPLWVAGKGTLVSDTVEQGGFANITSVKGYQQFNIESLTAQPPDVYIVPSKESQSTVLRQLRADSRLSKLPCIQAGRIIAMNGDLLLRPGPRLFQGIQQLQRAADKWSRKPAA